MKIELKKEYTILKKEVDAKLSALAKQHGLSFVHEDMVSSSYRFRKGGFLNGKIVARFDDIWSFGSTSLTVYDENYIEFGKEVEKVMTEFTERYKQIKQKEAKLA